MELHRMFPPEEISPVSYTHLDVYKRQAHYREPLSVKELSGLSNYSEFYFMKLFKQYTGKTAAAYLNDYRLEKAKSLLLHTDASVTDIALDVGFNNTSYFIKKFQEANQLSPHKFRKKMS